MNPMFYFLFALTLVFGANAVRRPVLDKEGKPISNGSYYVMSSHFRFGSGLTILGNGDNQICPLDIVQEVMRTKVGLPVKFSNWRTKDAFVPEFTDLNIETIYPNTTCTYWQLSEFDDERKQFFVVAGSKPEGYKEDSLKSFFRIVKDGPYYYRFVFCPRDLKCKNVGIFIDEKGVRRLALISQPLRVVFVNSNHVHKLSAKNM